MSNPKCPLCQSRKLAEVGKCTPDDAACFGIVLRDVVPMQELAYKLCTEHVHKIARYYDIMDQLALEEELAKSGSDVDDEAWDDNTQIPELISTKDKKDLN